MSIVPQSQSPFPSDDPRRFTFPGETTRPSASLRITDDDGVLRDSDLPRSGRGEYQEARQTSHPSFRFDIHPQHRLSSEEVVDVLAEYALASTGRRRSLAAFVEGDPTIRQMFSVYVNQIEPVRPGMLRERILSQGVTSSVPLTGIRTNPVDFEEDLSWGGRARFDRAYMRQCPNSMGRSDRELETLESRAARIQWEQVGALLEPAIRARLGLNQSVAISVCVFGSFLWKANPSDIDMVVVIEDCRNSRMTIGRPTLQVAGLREALPAECGLASDTVELCVVGLGALHDRQHFGQVTELLLPTTTEGVWIKGKPLLEDTSDLAIAQTWLSVLGNSIQESVMNPSYSLKAGQRIPFVQRMLLSLMDKYGIEDELRSRPITDAPITDPISLLEAFQMFRTPTELIISAIRERCANEIQALFPQFVARH